MAEGIFGTRQRAPSIDPVAIQPAGVPGSTFVRPQQVAAGGNLQALAESLGGLNRALSGFAAVKAQEDQDPASRANKAFLDSIQGKDTAELQLMASNGDFSNHIQEDGLKTLLGSKANSDFRNFAAEWYETEFDKVNGNLAAELEQKRQEFAQALPDDAARASFFKGSEEWTQRFLMGDIDRRVKTAAADRNEAVVDEFRTIADDALANGATPEEVAAQVIRQSGLNRSFRGLTGQEQNATLYSLAQEYALQGRTDIVRALLEDDRGGVGSVAKSSEYAVKSAQLIEAAEDKANETEKEGAFDLFTQIDREVAGGTLTDQRMKEIVEQNPFLKGRVEQTSAWVQQSGNNRRRAQEQLLDAEGKRLMQREAAIEERKVLADATHTLTTLMGAHRLEDREVLTPSGGTRTYTKKDQVDDAVKLYQQQFRRKEQELVQGGMAPEQAAETILREKVNFFAGNAIPNPEWENAFNGTAIVASASTLAQGGNIPERLADISETYYKINKLNPAFAASLVSNERAGEFLEAYADARDDLTLGKGQSPQDALMEAARMANRTPEEKQATSVTRKEAEDVVKRAMSSGWFFGPSVDRNFRDNAENIATATKLVQTYMGRGMAAPLAVDKAKEVLKERAVYVNGVAILQRGKVFPKDFAETAEGYLDSFAKSKNPEATGDDLFLMDSSDGTDRLIIMRKDGIPVGSLSNEDLDGYRRTKRDEAVVEAAKWGRNVEKDGPVLARLKWALNGFEVVGGNMKPEEAQKFLQDADEKAKIDAWLQRTARNDGIRYDSLNGRWMRGSGSIWSRSSEVRPVVTWSTEEKSVRWEPVKGK
jgi:hypothetical protein